MEKLWSETLARIQGLKCEQDPDTDRAWDATGCCASVCVKGTPETDAIGLPSRYARSLHMTSAVVFLCVSTHGNMNRTYMDVYIYIYIYTYI